MYAEAPSLEDVAEAPLAWVEPETGGIVDRTDPRFVLQHSPVSGSPEFGSVLQVRLDHVEDVDRAIADARRWFRQNGRARSSWQVRESMNPPGLVEALLSRGMRRHPTEENGYAAMAADASPRGEWIGHVVRRAETAEEHMIGVDILIEVFGLSDADATDMRRRVADPRGRPKQVSTYLAYLDGRPAARGTVLFTPGGDGALFAGATLPWARGRGLHKALVAARFQEAVQRGGRGVVVLAGSASRPGFEQLGFRFVDTITVLRDE